MRERSVAAYEAEQKVELHTFLLSTFPLSILVNLLLSIRYFVQVRVRAGVCTRRRAYVQMCRTRTRACMLVRAHAWLWAETQGSTGA